MKQFLFLLICVICFGEVTNAQKFNKVSSSGGVLNYSVIDPADGTPWLGVPPPVTTSSISGSTSIAAGGSSPALTCFIEFGDGTFSFSPSGTHTFFTTPINREVTTKFTGIYTGGGKPPSYQAAKGDPPSSAYIAMDVLGSSESIHITPNIGDVLASDTMIFVVTYKLETIKENGNLVFLFNDGNTIFDIFSLNETFKDPLNSNTVNFVRTYFTEKEIYESSLLPKATAARNKYPIYNNTVSIKDLVCDGKEHNIFITLVPNSTISVSKAARTFVRAILTADTKTKVDSETNPQLIEPKGSKIDNGIIGETELELQVRDNSHDPNYINATPACMVFPKEGKKVDYHLHFQNTGLGGAPKVRVAIKIPEGVDLEKDINYKPGSNWYKIHGTVTNTWPFNNTTKDSLVFIFEKDVTTLTTVALKGMDYTDPTYKEGETTGDVWFSIKTTTATATIMLAQASIVFYNNGSPIPNVPVITNTAVTQFRECCDCEKKCDKCKNKGKLWRWLFCKKC